MVRWLISCSHSRYVAAAILPAKLAISPSHVLPPQYCSDAVPDTPTCKVVGVIGCAMVAAFGLNALLPRTCRLSLLDGWSAADAIRGGYLPRERCDCSRGRSPVIAKTT